MFILQKKFGNYEGDVVVWHLMWILVLNGKGYEYIDWLQHDALEIW